MKAATVSPPQSDASVRQAAPNTNYAQAARLLLRGTGSARVETAYLHFTRPFDATGATVIGATLRLYRAGAWPAGTYTVTVRRVNQPWSESTITYTKQPTTDPAHAVSVSPGAGADGSLISVDVSTIFQDVAAGAVYQGLQVTLTQDAEVALRSSEYSDPKTRPGLDVTWSLTPDVPAQLTPSNGEAVNETRPILFWQAPDQAAWQLQTSTDPLFGTTGYDSGQTTGTQQSLDLATTSFPAMALGATRYWRVRVWNDAGLVSAWSAAAQMVRTALSALTLNAPGATVNDLTPPVSWTFAGAQTRYRVTLYRIDPTGPTQLWQTDVGDAATTTITLPSGYLASGQTFQVTAEVWDNVARYLSQHASVSQQFTYVRSGTPAAPTGLTVTPLAGQYGTTSPGVRIAFSRATMPDYWCLRVDGVEVSPRIAPGPTFVSGTSYAFTYWGLTPRVSHTVEVEAVVQSGAGAPYLNSGPNPTVTLTPTPVGIWLVDPVDGRAVQLLGDDSASWAIGETGTTYTPISTQAPVRITDQVRGQEGAVTGYLVSDADRDTFLALKGRRTTLQLILAHLSFPIVLEDAHCNPSPVPEVSYEAGFSFFQAGGPWPVAS